MKFRVLMPDGMEDDHECCGNCGDKQQKLPEQAIQAECMRDALAAFQWSCTKKVGQLVTFKRGIHAGIPELPKDTIFVIAEVFEPPMMCAEDAHSTSFGRKHDLGLLAYDLDVGAIWFCMDSRFFEDYSPSELEA